MNFSDFHSIGTEIAAVDTGLNYNVVAAAGSDNAEVAGVIIDRESHGMPLSGCILIGWKATLGAAATLSIGYRLEHGDAANLSDTADFAKQLCAGNVVQTASASGGTYHGVLKVDLDLAGAKRYLRLNITEDLSAANTDVAVLSASPMVFGGEQVGPAI